MSQNTGVFSVQLDKG